MIQISFLEISKSLRISERTAKRYIKKDLENGLITKEATQYQCRKYKKPLSGRNIYSLTEKGKNQINSSKQGDLTPLSLEKKNSSKEEFAKGKPPEPFHKFKREKDQIFGKYKCSHLSSRAPQWWFRDLKVLEKTLKLLIFKKKKGYRVKDEASWISSVIRDRGRGFSHKVAKQTALVLANNRKQSMKVVMGGSEKLLADFDQLKELKKRGLNTSFREMEKLLRKGVSHLSLCSSVLLRLLKYQPVKDINGFLHWLVCLKEPIDIFKKSKPKKEKESVPELRMKRLLLWINQNLEKVVPVENIPCTKQIVRLQPDLKAPEDTSENRKKAFFQVSEKTLFRFWSFQNGEWKHSVIDANDKGALDRFTSICVHDFGASSEDISKIRPEIQSLWNVKKELMMLADLEKMAKVERKGFYRMRVGTLQPKDTRAARNKIHFRFDGTHFWFFLFDRAQNAWKRFSVNTNSPSGYKDFSKLWKEKFSLSNVKLMHRKVALQVFA